MDSQKFIIKNKFVKITPFTKKNITNTYIRRMNRPEINKYLVTKKFTKQNCLEYYLDKKKEMISIIAFITTYQRGISVL